MLSNDRKSAGLNMCSMPLVRPKLFRTSRGLIDVLAALEPCSTDLQWYCMELDSCSLYGPNGELRSQAIQDVCNEIKRSHAGVLLSWERAESLARDLHLEDMVLFIATKPEFPPPLWPLNLASPLFEITIQTAENESLYVMTRNEMIITRLLKSLSDCHELFPESAHNPGRSV